MEEKPNISKQVIVIRKDLNMRKGKMVAQGSHASLKVILDLMQFIPVHNGAVDMCYVLVAGSAIKDWIEGKFTKVCVSVDSLEELNTVYEKAKSAGIPCSLITDIGLTEFNGIPTVTCCAIGPAWSNEVDLITGHLKLL